MQVLYSLTEWGTQNQTILSFTLQAYKFILHRPSKKAFFLTGTPQFDILNEQKMFWITIILGKPST